MRGIAVAKRNSFERLQAPGERTPLSQRWPVILLALLLVWPLGLTLLLLKLLKAARGGRVVLETDITARSPRRGISSFSTVSLPTPDGPETTKTAPFL